MGHAFRGYVHRASSDHDGELTIVFKTPPMYYDDVTAIGKLTKQMLFITVHTEADVRTTDEGGDHADVST